jgi:hypothetical protein
MKTIYRVKVTVGTREKPISRSFIFGSRYEADAFLSEANSKFGCTEDQLTLDHVMTRKEALEEIRAELEHWGY